MATDGAYPAVYLERQPYVVIDQNVLRDALAVEQQFRRCEMFSWQVLLPDTAIYEFSRGTHAYLQWRLSLEHLSRHPNRVVAGRHLGTMMRSEMTTGQSDILLHDAVTTPHLQELLHAIAVGNDDVLNATLARVAGIVESEMVLRETHADNRARLILIRDAWRMAVSDADLRQLRNHDQATSVRLLAGLLTAQTCRKWLETNGCTPQVAAALTVGPSVCAHVFYGLAALALDWLARGGLDAARPEVITNDVADLDYICTASFCHDLISQDVRANRVYDTMIRAFQTRHEEFLAIANNEMDSERPPPQN